ncbi:YfbU family protein [Nocardioides conyzicola]|uniref:YfbU family protein n=1 Tax=Nocardioides conyzicola TaxID=1651781 RepID=A0ABP8XBT9_9ACTN
MPTITIRVSDDVRDDIEDLATARGMTVSELLRTQIDALRGRGEETDGPTTPLALGDVQRLILSQQHEILAALRADDPGDVEYHQKRMAALQGGYTLEYSDEFASISPELSREDCRLVMDILDMFRLTSHALTQLSDDERVALGEDVRETLEFNGFDLNDTLEGHMLEYVRYLVSNRRWAEVEPRLSDMYDGGNSHCPMLPMYKRMLTVHQQIRAQRRADRGASRSVYEYDADDLRAIAAAG